MDDAARPLDVPGEPDDADTLETGDEVKSGSESVAAYAPPPREEAAPRLDLQGDPFAPPAPAYPVLDSEPVVAAIDSAPEAGPVTAVTEEAPGEDATAEVPTEEPPTADATVVRAEVPAAEDETYAADLSLEDMVDELKTGEEPLDETAPADTEAAEEGAEQGESEATAEEGEEPAEEGEEVAEPATWRDAAAAASAVTVPEPVRRRLSTRLPFWIYGGAWAVFVGTLTYLMWPLSDKPFVDDPYYAYLVYGGAGMLGIGLVVAITVWAVARSGTSKTEREGLVRAVWLRAAGWMAVGVILWWAGMYALDMHRLGLIG
jgi:hypothetical protein